MGGGHGDKGTFRRIIALASNRALAARTKPPEVALPCRGRFAGLRQRLDSERGAGLIEQEKVRPGRFEALCNPVVQP